MIQAGVQSMFHIKEIDWNSCYSSGHMNLAAAKETVENLYLAMENAKYSTDKNCNELIDLFDNQKADEEFIRKEDVLLVPRISEFINNVRTNIIHSNLIRSPGSRHKPLAKNHRIVNGIEFDIDHHKVAYWIVQEDGSIKRLVIFAEKTGERLVWLVSQLEADQWMKKYREITLEEIMIPSKTSLSKEPKSESIENTPSYFSIRLFCLNIVLENFKDESYVTADVIECAKQIECYLRGKEFDD